MVNSRRYGHPHDPVTAERIGVTSVSVVQVGLDDGKELLVLVEAGVVVGVVTKAVHRHHVRSPPQQNLHGVLTAILTAQDQCRPAGQGRPTWLSCVYETPLTIHRATRCTCWAHTAFIQFLLLNVFRYIHALYLTQRPCS